MPKCVTCGQEVTIQPNKIYVYVLINIGQPGKEKPLYFHYYCFVDKTIKKRSNLWKEHYDSLISSL